MKKIALCAAVLAISTIPAAAQFGQQQSGFGGYGTGSNPNSHYVQPHINSNGSTTQGHYQTNSNNTQLDNYSTRGNYNPYTGRTGTRTPRGF